ncbi:sensor histidine kinase [Rheinheimera sp.]|uniref:sensor histidine kinase n=1 Tax=Rheinheimera sp. TaxID=1869214 RepID=UPI003D2DCBA7
MVFKRTPHIADIILLALALSGSGALAMWLWLQQGASAMLLVCTLLTLLWMGLLLRLYWRQQQLPIQMFRALANGDHTLGLPAHHLLRQSYESARERLQQTRIEAEAQAQFLRHVLLHTELSLLIYHQDGRVIEQSPAAARLLGQRLTHIDQLTDPLRRCLIGEPLRAVEPVADIGLNTPNPAQRQPLARHSTVSWWRGDQPDTLAVMLNPVQIAGEAICLATLQSIHQPLNQREQEAYNKLTRVLTHEIANSITPMASIAQSCAQLLPDGLCFADESDKADVQMALQTLGRRTAHLVEFIQNFRKVAAVPAPILSYKPLGDVVHQVAQLWQSQCQSLGIELVQQLLDNRVVAHDPAQLEQVLINLVKNAVDALGQQAQQHTAVLPVAPPQILLTLAPLNDAQTMIEIRDNGPGITAETASMMFVPFFTTKPQGSGIGLALARQIIRQHGGDLVHVPTSTGACFRVMMG